MSDVAVLGTGRMGAAMAGRLVAAGHSVRVWNRTRAKADALAASLGTGLLRIADSPAEAVKGAAVVLSMLANGTATREVLLDESVRAALGPATVVVDLATSGTEAAQTLSLALSASGTRFVDAPVSGSIPSVVSGSLLVMAGGSQDAVEAVTPVLSAFARTVLRVGEAGAGQVMKLAVNLVVHDLNAALSEALRLAENSGVPRESAYTVLQESVVGAPFLQYKREAFLDPTAPVAMSLALTEKDLWLITEHARATGERVPVTEQALATVRRALRAGLGEQDMAALSRVPGPAATE